MYCASILINSYAMEQFLKRIALMKVLFCSTHSNSDVSHAHDILNEEFQKLGSNVPHIVDSKENDNADDDQPTNIFDFKPSLDHDTEEETINASTQQPFGTYVSLKLSKVAVCTAGKKANPFSNAKFFKYIEKNWIPTMPFWSSLLLGKCMHVVRAYMQLTNSCCVGDLSRYLTDVTTSQVHSEQMQVFIPLSKKTEST